MALTATPSACRAVVPYVPRPRVPAVATHDLVVTPHPLTLQGQTITRAAPVQPGDTLAQLLARHGVDLAQPGWCVRVGGLEVPAALCARTRARPGMLIEAHRVPGKSALRLVAMVALAYFTMGSGPMAAGAGQVGGLGGFLGFNGFTAYAINAGAFMLGSMVINKLLPPPGASSYSGASPGTTYSLQGARNGARQYGPLGLLFGQVRVSPDFAAQPFTWFEGDDQYQYVQLHAGLNVHTVEALQVGETDLASYSGVQVSRTGFASGNTTMLAWESVDTVAGGALDAVTAPGAYVTRTGSANTVRLQLDIVGDLHYINSGGSPQRFTCNVDIEYREVSSGTWLPFVGSSATVELANSTTKPLRRTISRDVAAGQYTVRMRKATKNEARSQAANVVEWASLKSYQADTGTAVARQVVGIRIKASGQLNGTLDQVTWLATSTPCPVWNGSSWVTQTTSNPGALILQFARGVFAPDGRLLWGYGKPDGQIDIDGLKAFMVHCTAQGYRFDHWFTEQISRRDVLDAIAAVGMASISRHTGKLGVVYMAAGQPIEAVVNMANIKRGSFRVDYATRTTAEEIEIASPERTNGWRPASLRVLAPGVTVPRETARRSPAGITTEAGRLLAARSVMGQNLYGRKAESWEMDLEHLTVRRWSMLALSHDLTQWGHGGRLHGLVTNIALYSEDLRNTAEAGSSRPWVQFDDTGNAVVVDHITTAPPAGMQAYNKLKAGTTGAAQRQLIQTFPSIGNGTVVAFELLAQAAECQYLGFGATTRSGHFPQVLFNLATGAVQTTVDAGGAGIVGSVEPTQDAGWWRCKVVLNVLSGATTPGLFVIMRTAANGNFAAAAVGDGLYLTGVQTVVGGSIGAYARTTGAAAVGIELDAEVPAGSTPHVGLRLPGEAAYRVFEVAAFTGTAHNLTLATAWPGGVDKPGATADNPAMDTLWVFDFKATPGQRLRITDIAPTADMSGARITAVPEPDEFWAFMATGAYTVPAGTASRPPVVVSNLQVTQERLTLSYDLTAELAVHFAATGPYDHAQVWGAAGDDALQLLGETRTTRFSGWRVVNTGTVHVEVRPFDALGRPGAVLAGSHLVAVDTPLVPQGNLLPVAELVQGLSRSAAGGFMVGHWGHFSDAAAPVGPTSELVMDTGPDGQPTVIWRSTSGSGGSEQGGFERVPDDPVDQALAYRFAAWVRTSGAAHGLIYLGCSNVLTLAGATTGTPFFFYVNSDTLVDGRWYLAAGYVYAAGHTGSVSLSGLWDGVTGTKMVDGQDYKWAPDAFGARWSLFQGFTDAAGAVFDQAPPMVHVVDGTEPSIAALLAMSARGRVAWLTASSQVFAISKAGTVSPGSITLTAQAQNLAGSPSFAVTSGTATLGGSGNTRTLAYADMATDAVTITMTWAGISDSITLVKLREGADAKLAFLGNESHTVATAADGTGGSFGSAGGTFFVFDGVTDKTGDAAVTYSVASSSGVSISIASTGIYTVTAMSADTATATLRAVYAGVTFDRVYSIAKSRAGVDGADGVDGDDGADGAPAISSSLTRLVANFTADSTGLVDAGQSFATTMAVLLGTVDDTSNWTISRTSSDASITTSISGTTVTITGIGTSLDTGTVAVKAERLGYPDQLILVQVGKVKRAVPSAYPAAFGFDVTNGVIINASASAYARLNSDGTLDTSLNGSSWTAAGNWFSPTTSGIGSSYRVADTVTGSALTAGDTPSFVSLASGHTFQLTQAPGGPGTYLEKRSALTIRIADNSSTTPLAVGYGAFYVYVDRT